MVYAAVLAGGAGKRMLNSDMPKQFLPLGDKSIIERASEHFLVNPSVDSVFAAVPEGWESHAASLLRRDDATGAPGIVIVRGGSDRTMSLMAVIEKIKELYGIQRGDIIITHDAVRPFITQRIINDNIKACKESGAAATAYMLTDTPFISENGATIQEIPPRSNYFLAQTPQTFNLGLLYEICCSLTGDERAALTDAAKMFLMRNLSVRIVLGESYNIKITTPFDYAVALTLIK